MARCGRSTFSAEGGKLGQRRLARRAGGWLQFNQTTLRTLNRQRGFMHPLRRFLLSFAWLLATGLRTPLHSEEASPAGDSAAEVSRFEAPEKVGVIADERIVESSGLAHSLYGGDRFWTHNDSGD